MSVPSSDIVRPAAEAPMIERRRHAEGGPCGAPPLGIGTFAAMSAAAGLASIQFWMAVPLAALALAGRGIPPWQIGFIGAVPWIVLVILVPLVPRLAATYGTLRIFRFGCWLGVAGAIAFAAGSQAWMWVIGYTLCGAGIALRWIVSDALVALLSPPASRGRRVGLFETWIGATMAIGPMILALTGTTGPLPFLIGVILAVLSLPPAFAIRIPAADAPSVSRHSSLSALAAAAQRHPATLVATAACGIIEGASTKLLAVQTHGLGLSDALAAASVAVFAAGNLLTQYPAGHLADRLPSHRLLPAALAIVTAAALVLPMTTTSPVFFFALLALLGGSTGSLYTLSVFRAGHAASPSEALTEVAGISLAYTLGSTLGPMLAGAAVSADLRWGLPLVIATTGLCGLGLILLLSRRRLTPHTRAARDDGSPLAR